MDNDNQELIINFLRRWSTMDITPENRLLFEEHRISIQALTGDEGELIVQGLSIHSSREEFIKQLQLLKDF